MRANKKLAFSALLKGAGIEAVRALLSAQNYTDIARFYFGNSRFCAGRDLPGLNFARRYLKGQTEPLGVFVDADLAADNMPEIAALGDTTGTAKYSDYSVSRLFLKHGAAVEVEATGHAFLIIDIYDRASVSVKATETATVIIYTHGGTVAYHETKDRATVEINPKY